MYHFLRTSAVALPRLAIVLFVRTTIQQSERGCHRATLKDHSFSASLYELFLQLQLILYRIMLLPFVMVSGFFFALAAVV